MKLYELCTYNGIMLGFIIYHGNIGPNLIVPPGDEYLQTERIPLTLLEPYLDRGHTVYLDNYYTMPRLAQYLLQRQTKLVGTVRANRRCMPQGIATKNLDKGKAAFYSCDNVMVVKYRAAKDNSKGKPKTVCLVSTAHSAEMRNTSSRDAHGDVIKKPSCIMSYNVKMGGVDRMDQQLHSINFMRRSYKWYKKVFMRMMMVCVLSAHKLYQLQGGRSDFLTFIHDIITELLINAPRLKTKYKGTQRQHNEVDR